MGWLKHLFGGEDDAPAKDDARAQLMARLKAHQSTAWLPEVSDGDGPGTASKFGGKACIPSGTEWPTCPHCKLEMALCVQLNPEHLPAGFKERLQGKLLQFFYCVSTGEDCETFTEAWEPFSLGSVVRLVDIDEAAVREAPASAGLACKTVQSWSSEADYPGPYWLQDHDIDIDEDEMELLWDEGFPLAGDKLGAYPKWVQGPEHPNCRSCQKQMELLFQVESNDNVDFMWGDMGCGHITQCPDHPEELTFAWACG